MGVGFVAVERSIFRAPAVQAVDIAKHYDVRVMKITSSMEMGSHISVLRDERDRQMTPSARSTSPSRQERSSDCLGRMALGRLH
jgi:hypothetical protein